MHYERISLNSFPTDSLGMKQELFAYMLALLIEEAHKRGYRIRVGEVWRSDAAAAATPLGRRGVRSLHQDKLAVDINLFRDGVYLDETEDHRELGEWWERLHPLASWGGHFNDGNHYSLTHGGRR